MNVGAVVAEIVYPLRIFVLHILSYSTCVELVIMLRVSFISLPAFNTTELIQCMSLVALNAGQEGVHVLQTLLQVYFGTGS
jgi:hypothetical protein